MITMLWVLAVILVAAGIGTARHGQVLFGIASIVVGLLVGLGGASIIT